MTASKPKAPTPDGTPAYDDQGRCVFCGSLERHVHAEPRPNKRAKAKHDEETVSDGED